MTAPEDANRPRIIMPIMKRALLVEDSDFIADDMKRKLLSRTCKEVIRASTQQEALDIYEKHRHKQRFDFALIDASIPEKHGPRNANPTKENGLRLIEKIRISDSSLPIVAYSGLAVDDFDTRDVLRIAQARASFLLIRLQMDEEVFTAAIWMTIMGYTVQSPRGASLLEQVIRYRPQGNPLEEWEYRVLYLRANEMTLTEIAGLTDVPEETLRADAQRINRILSSYKLLDTKRPTADEFKATLSVLSALFGPPDPECPRPARVRGFASRNT